MPSFQTALIVFGGILTLVSALTAVVCLIGGAMRPDPDFSVLDDPAAFIEQFGVTTTQYIPGDEIAEACIEAARALEEVHRLTDPHACGPDVFSRFMTSQGRNPPPVMGLYANIAPVLRSLRELAVAADPAALVEVP